jgi:hypothetical protein
MPVDTPWNEHHPTRFVTYQHDEHGILRKVPLVVGDEVQHAVDPDLASGLGTEEATEDVNLLDLDLLASVCEQQPVFTDSGNIVDALHHAYELRVYGQEYLTIREHKTIIQDRINYYSKPINFEDNAQWNLWCTAMNTLYHSLEGSKEAREKIMASCTAEAISARPGFLNMPMAKLVAVVISECGAGDVYNDMDPTWRVSRAAFWATMDALTCLEVTGNRETTAWVRAEKDAHMFRDAIKDLILEKRPAPVMLTATVSERVVKFENMVRSFSDHEEKMLAMMPYYRKPLDFENDIQMGAWNAILDIIHENIIDVGIRDRIINAAMPDAIVSRGFQQMRMAKLLAVIIHEAARYGLYDDTDMFWRVHEDVLEETLDILTCEWMMGNEGTTAWLRGGGGEEAWRWMNAFRDLITE